MKTENDCTRLVATIGLHGSASTWIFNAVRELMANSAGDDEVLTIFADALVELPHAAECDERYLLVKSHAGSPQLDEWLAVKKARIVLSVRDPRDACVSTMQRFSLAFDSAICHLAYDCARLIRLAAEGHAVLRYENRFFDDPGTVSELADWLGLKVPGATMKAVFDRYRTDAVRLFVRGIPDLPAERLRTVRGAMLADNVTYFVNKHIGDGRSRKWLDLPIKAQNELTRIFEPFLQFFGYPC